MHEQYQTLIDIEWWYWSGQWPDLKHTYTDKVNRMENI